MEISEILKLTNLIHLMVVFATRMLSKFIIRGSCALQNLPTCYEKLLHYTNNPEHVTANNDMFLKELSFSFI